MLIGDILLSRVGAEASHIDSPLRDNLGSVLPEEWQRTVSGVSRKVVRINDWLVISWAGDRVAAQVIVSQIRQQHGAAPPSKSSFFSSLVNANWQLGRTSAVIVGWVNDNGTIAFRWDSSVGFYVSIGEIGRAHV